MERLILFAAIALIFTLGAFTFYYFNTQILLQPAETFFNVEDTLAPVGSSLSGDYGLIYDSGQYLFYYSPVEGMPVELLYAIDTFNPEVQKGLIDIRELVSGVSIENIGTNYRNSFGNLLTPLQLSQQANVVFSHQILSNNIARLSYVETFQGVTTQKQFDVQIIGKTLVIEARSINPLPGANNNYAGFYLGTADNVVNPNYIEIPYMENAQIIISGNSPNKLYLTNYFDPLLSGSSNWPIFQNIQETNRIARFYSSSYRPGELNLISPLQETLYLTMSDDINEVMPNVNRNPSIYLSDLKDRVTLDVWVTGASTYFSGADRFEKSTSLINAVKDYGMDNLLVSYTPWNEVGNPPCYLMYPKHLPANIFGGGEIGFSNFVSSATNNEFLFAVYQIYTDMYSTPSLGSTEQFGPQWDPSKITKNPDGTYRNFGYVHQGCPQLNINGQLYNQPLVIKPDKWTPYAETESLLIKQNYQTTAGFLDVHPKLSYPLLIDFSADSLTRSFIDVYQYSKQLFQLQRDTYQGPLVGEGGTAISGFVTDTIHAGLVDAVEGEITNGKDAKIIPDFELRNVKSKMMRQGMGYLNRWEKTPSSPIDHSTFNLDKIRSMQLSYGHSGFMTDYDLLSDSSFTAWPQNLAYHTQVMKKVMKYWVSEYYLFSEFQKLYLQSDIVSVHYQNPSGNLVELAQAIESNVNFFNPKLKLEYQNGLIIYINMDQNPVSVWQVSLDNKNYFLPSNGWLAFHPDTELMIYSGLMDNNGNPSATGHRVDFANTLSYVMMNGRGVQTSFQNDLTGTTGSTYLTVIKPSGWMLMEDSSGGFSTSTLTLCGDNYCSASLSENCNTCTVDCGICPPTAPSNLAVTTIGSDSLQLNWQDTSDSEQGFRLQSYLHPNVNWQDVPGASNLAAGTVSYTHNGLNANSQYYYRVSAYNSGGESAFSNIANGLTSQIQTTTGSGTPGSSSGSGNSGSSSGSNSGSGSGSGSGTVAPRAQCNNDIDDDDDGLIDFPADPGCTSLNGNSELDIPEEQITNIDEEQPEQLGTENKGIQIRIVFWGVILLLISGIVFAGIKIMRVLNNQNRFKELAKVSSEINNY